MTRQRIIKLKTLLSTFYSASFDNRGGGRGRNGEIWDKVFKGFMKKLKRDIRCTFCTATIRSLYGSFFINNFRVSHELFWSFSH